MKTVSKVSVIGLGYIGLPTAAVFADRGVEVVGVDVTESVVQRINAGEPHFVEPNLAALVRRVVEAGKLRASLTPEPADVFIVAVPTPFQDIEGHHWPDVSYIERAARAIAPVLKPGNLVILESTSPVGTTERMCGWMAEERPDLTFPTQKGETSDIRVAHCPERVLPGRILDEVVNNARVIGGITRKCAQQALQVYKIICEGECRPTSARTAELAKLTENAYRDVNIAFANELSVICDRLKINVWELIKLANLHPRVDILRPGPGVGGHCIAVDPWFIVDSAPEEARLIRAAREVNDSKPGFVCAKVREKARSLVKPVIACLGLSYKKDVDDLRESPAVHIVAELAKEKIGRILVVEPHISALPKDLQGLDLELADFDHAMDQANMVVLLVDHMTFLTVDHDILKDKFVIDTVGVW
ncbi:UDP-N-acetyl-D-mannosamine dehydrogenase [Azospirillum sp. RWY-5-1]|uniref:UDP-N-acetyl-D-mannosamine dehydrogenase n=1 Tax=Azospirillum oleiclasticum TaxID=2735135 RepID=A0ABX2TLC0_9PROT|nr:UDP-N-acetyl-D-mannosamine dehydrogenase [Azospirillum oleiclasticum]NYZ16385.1 UDP-N-acetyl-D-mannosamine dehydrogenase [Azospirillum oleiclasticum]NYZ23899.1 UDP-N-acetyl-D-mannosamine dehydrogenase [Azospirillum oleiclasticum]